MLHVVVALEVASWLETHQGHANSIKFLYRAHLLLRKLDFFAADGIISPDFLSVKRLPCLIANEPLGRSQLLIVHSVDLLNVWLLGWDDCAEEAQANFSSR